jgi:thiol-disulfide isomerase/thioredoxin
MIVLTLVVAIAACNKPADEQPLGTTDVPQDGAAEGTESAEQLLAQASEKAREGNLDEATELLRKAQALDPSNDQLKFMLLSVLQAQGMRLAGSDRKAAGQHFYEAATLAKELLDALPNMSSQQRMPLAVAIYNAACAYSVDDQVDKALVALDEAFAAGFDDFEQVARDGDFDAIRENEEFQALIAKHREAFRERLVAELTEEMAAHESYAFDFALPSTEGETITKNDFKGKVLIADIWGTWCPPCRAEIPHFVKLRDEYGAQGLEIVGLNYERGGDDAAKVQKITSFMEEEGMNYVCVLGDEATRAQVPNFRGFPTTLFIDKSGDVRLTLVGLQPYDKLEAIVQLLLEE